MENNLVLKKKHVINPITYGLGNRKTWVSSWTSEYAIASNFSFRASLVKRNENLLRMPKRSMMLRSTKKGAEKTVHTVTVVREPTKIITRQQHTVHYSPDKEENKPNPEPLKNWVSDTETRAAKPGVKESLAKYPVKHPKVGLNAIMQDPKQEEKEQLNIALTHKLPSKQMQEKFDFKTLSWEFLGKDPKTGKPQYIIITNRVTNAKEIRSAPANEELTKYLKAHPEYPAIINNLIKNAQNTLRNEQLGNTGINPEKHTLTENTQTKKGENPYFTQNNKQEEQRMLFLPLQKERKMLFLPLAEIKPLQITSSASALPAFSMAEKEPSVRENLERLAQKKITSNSHGTLSNNNFKNLKKPNEHIDKHNTEI